MKRRRISTLLGDLRGARQSLFALTLLAMSSVGAGVVLGVSDDRLEELPGLLLLVPAAIALRGNIFGSLGSRLGTAIHTGTFRLSVRPTSVVGRNVLASIVLTLAMSLALAVLAKTIAELFGLSDSMSLADFIVISVIAGVLASVVVLVIALALAAGSARFGWDPDNVTAPLITATADLLTLPALILAAALAERGGTTVVLAIVLTVVSVGALVEAWRSGGRRLRVLLAESIPVLLVAGILDLIAGLAIEAELESFAQEPILLVLLPGYLAAAGALGGILSSRLSSKFHLGLITASVVPRRGAQTDIAATFALCLPVFAITALVAQAGGAFTDIDGPGTATIVGVALIGGILATGIVVAVAYYGTMFAVRFGVDPDTYGIPLVTSTLDLVGAFTFLAAIALFGLS